MGFIKYNLTVDKAVVNKINSLSDLVMEKVFPKVVNRMVRPIRQSIINKLPDGQQSGTRALQSKTTKRKFPHSIQLKKFVRRKSVKDTTGMLVIVGVSNDASHVNFDHGNKALTEGRKHVLWGRYNTDRATPPLLRKQTQNIPLLVSQEFEGRVGNLMAEELARQLAKK